MKKKRLGEERYNNEGCKMKIIEYNNANDIIVEFQDEHKVKVRTAYKNFKKGSVRNPYHPKICGIGFIGQGKYTISENGEIKKVYEVWNSMLKRCYDPYYLNKEPSYIDCYVEKYLHNFQNFAKWWEENYYEIPNEKMQLDKDILEKGNKMYDREHMIFVPKRINTLFVKNDVNRGKYPIGVYYNKKENKFRSQLSFLNKEGVKKRKDLGRFNTSTEAFNKYKIEKENYIKQVADEYKDFIPIELYNAMYNYEVEIND